MTNSRTAAAIHTNTIAARKIQLGTCNHTQRYTGLKKTAFINAHSDDDRPPLLETGGKTCKRRHVQHIPEHHHHHLSGQVLRACPLAASRGPEPVRGKRDPAQCQTRLWLNRERLRSFSQMVRNRYTHTLFRLCAQETVGGASYPTRSLVNQKCTFVQSGHM